MSYNKTIAFNAIPVGFTVSPPVYPQKTHDEVSALKDSSYLQGKQEATDFYNNEIKKLREDFETRQKSLLSLIEKKCESVLLDLNHKLPDLVVGLSGRVINSLDLDAENIKSIVLGLLADFGKDEECIEVYLNPADLKLLKSLNDSDKETVKDETESNGFASAIAGIFDGLDGNDSVLMEYPHIKFIEDESLTHGDCQVKSKFGLLDGRVSTKLRRITEEMNGD